VHLERGSARAHLRAVGKHANSNVSKILPLTTFRTIDLAGRKISGPLFSRFWAETRVFLSLTAGSQPRSDLRRTRPIMMKRNTSSLRQLRSAASRNQLQAAENQRNSNVSKILPPGLFTSRRQRAMLSQGCAECPRSPQALFVVCHSSGFLEGKL
jgi:hypothetical protein